MCCQPTVQVTTSGDQLRVIKTWLSPGTAGTARKVSLTPGPVRATGSLFGVAVLALEVADAGHGPAVEAHLDARRHQEQDG